MISRRLPALATLAFVAGGCAGTGTPQPAQLADRVTRAIYANDYGGTIADFDDSLKKTVTRASVGELSDRLHALGSLQGLTARSSDADRGRYDFDGTFDSGKVIVELRIDPSGKIGAYRLVPKT